MSEYDVIPDHILVAINAYVRRGQDPGQFLISVASNDLFESVAYADESCQKALPAIVRYFYNKVPGVCWGSMENVQEWMRHSGVGGDNVAYYELGLIEREL